MRVKVARYRYLPMGDCGGTGFIECTRDVDDYNENDLTWVRISEVFDAILKPRDPAEVHADEMRWLDYEVKETEARAEALLNQVQSIRLNGDEDAS